MLKAFSVESIRATAASLARCADLVDARPTRPEPYKARDYSKPDEAIALSFASGVCDRSLVGAAILRCEATSLYTAFHGCRSTRVAFADYCRSRGTRLTKSKLAWPCATSSSISARRSRGGASDSLAKGFAVSEVVSVAGRVANVPQGAANGAQGPAGSSPKVLQALDFEAKTWNAPTTPYKRRLVEPDEDTSSRPKTSQ